MPTLPTGRESCPYNEQLVSRLTVRLGLTAPEITAGADQYDTTSRCPSCGEGRLPNRPPYYCRTCGWSSIQNHFEAVPDPEAPRVKDAFRDPYIDQQSVAGELADTIETVEARLVKAGYLSPMTELWRLAPEAWKTQHDHYGQPTLFEYLLQDAVAVFAYISAADAGFTDFPAYCHHITTRDQQTAGPAGHRNAVETLLWLQQHDAPTDSTEVTLP